MIVGLSRTSRPQLRVPNTPSGGSVIQRKSSPEQQWPQARQIAGAFDCRAMSGVPVVMSAPDHQTDTVDQRGACTSR